MKRSRKIRPGSNASLARFIAFTVVATLAVHFMLYALAHRGKRGLWDGELNKVTRPSIVRRTKASDLPRVTTWDGAQEHFDRDEPFVFDGSLCRRDWPICSRINHGYQPSGLWISLLTGRRQWCRVLALISYKCKLSPGTYGAGCEEVLRCRK